jgi:tryptophanyl-tRNA synthetase
MNAILFKEQTMNKPNRILTGHRPTGPRHIGHLVGTLRNWVKLQETARCFFLAADLHVLTTDFQHPDRIQANLIEMVTDWLAAGIDPAKSTLVLQSAVPEHSQLCILLSMLVTESRLRRVPTYKEQVQQLNLQPSLGLLTYPVLQAADILLYQADTVPVGEDQLPHLELAREIVRRFNQLYNAELVEPAPLLSSQPRLPGTDNRTMHTSYGNAIYLRDTPAETTRKVMSMYTDPTRLRATDPGHVEGNPVFGYLDEFDPDPSGLVELKRLYQAGKVGDVEVKQRLAAALNQALAPLRQRREEISRRGAGAIEEILFAGTQKARQSARDTLKQVMDAMGLKLGADISARLSLTESVHQAGIFC